MNTIITAIRYVPWLIKEIVVSGLTLVRAGLNFSTPITPTLVSYPLRVTSDWHLFWLSTSITVTPGTLSCGFREPERPGEQRRLIVQAALGGDPKDIIADIADMERRLAPEAVTSFERQTRENPGGERPPGRPAGDADRAPSLGTHTPEPTARKEADR